MKWNDPQRDAYLKIEEEATRNRRASAADEARKPWRDRTYGKLKGKVTVRVMDIIIWATVALIVLAVIVGIAIGPQQ